MLVNQTKRENHLRFIKQQKSDALTAANNSTQRQQQNKLRGYTQQLNKIKTKALKEKLHGMQQNLKCMRIHIFSIQSPEVKTTDIVFVRNNRFFYFFVKYFNFRSSILSLTMVSF
jgi:hypothetical protein